MWARKGDFMVQGKWNQWVPYRGHGYKLGMVTQGSQEKLEVKTSLSSTVRIYLQKKPSEMAQPAATFGAQYQGMKELNLTRCPLPSTGTLWHTHPHPITFKDFGEKGG